MHDALPPLCPPMAQPPRRSGLAVASLVLGIAGLAVCLGPLAGIPGLICGHLARSRIRKSSGALAGRGMALAGLITSYLAVFLWIGLAVVAVLAFPKVINARRPSSPALCVTHLKAIQGAKTVWASENQKQPSDVPADSDLFGEDKYIRQKPTCPAGGTYRVNSVAEKPTCSIPGHAY